MTNDDVGKLACDVLTEAPFTALTDDVSSARLITRNFVITRRAELAKYAWNFAKANASVAGTELPASDFSGTLNWKFPVPAAFPGSASIITNGTFASDTIWSKGTGWTIAAGVATKAAGVASNLTEAVTIEERRSYRVTYTITAYTAGSVYAAFLDASGVVISGTARTAAGTYTEDLLAPVGITTFGFVADATFAGSIDTVSAVPLALTLRILPLTYDGEPQGIPISWRHEGDYVYSDQISPRTIRFISDMEDPDWWHPLFVDVMAAALAVKIAHPLTGKRDMIAVAQGAYDRAVAAAKRGNAIEAGGLIDIKSWALKRGDTRGWGRAF